jgi:ANTAR domain
VIGAINVYAHGKDVFDEHAAELGELFAKPAAVAVHNAQILAHALALTAQLQTALSTRPLIDQAIGLIRGRSGRSADEAFWMVPRPGDAKQHSTATVSREIGQWSRASVERPDHGIPLRLRAHRVDPR